MLNEFETMLWDCEMSLLETIRWKLFFLNEGIVLICDLHWIYNCCNVAVSLSLPSMRSHNNLSYQVYKSSEIHLESSKPLLDTGYQQVVSLGQGLHQFRFHYQLPTELPSTFNGVYGQITYLAKVYTFSGFQKSLSYFPWIII